MGCATSDCGDPACPVCWWARQPQPTWSASSREPMRDDAKADLPATSRERTSAEALYNEDGRFIGAAKKKHRVGPHR